jgi:hypothetical protein
MHDLVHEERSTRHVSCVFHYAEAEEENDDVGKEREDGAYPLHYAVHEHAGEPSGRQHGSEPGAKERDRIGNPLLGIGSERESEGKDQIKDNEKDRESEPAICQNLIHALPQGVTCVVGCVAECFGKRAVYEAFARVDMHRAEPLGQGEYAVLVFNESDAHAHEFAEETIVENVLRAKEVVVVRKEHNDRLLLLYELRCADKPLLKVEGIDFLYEPSVLYVFSGVRHGCSVGEGAAVAGGVLQIGLQR